MKRLQGDELDRGVRVRVTSGVHRGKTGVIEKVAELAVGLRYQLRDPESSRRGEDIVCWASADELEVYTKPAYVSQVAPEVTQRALGILTGKVAS